MREIYEYRMDYPTRCVENDQIQNIFSLVSSSAQLRFECKACDYIRIDEATQYGKTYRTDRTDRTDI